MDAITTKEVERPLSAFRLQGKVALITGGGGRIGRETASRFLREGAQVGLVDIDAEALRAAEIFLVSESQAQAQAQSQSETVAQDRILTIVGDVTSERDVEDATNSTKRKFGRLDIVFLNAGVSYTATSLFDTKEEDYERVMRLNVKSAFLGLKHAAKVMRDMGNGGSIILTSSIAGLRGTPGLILYSGSKFALRGLALTAAGELGQYGIRVNTIHPSGVDTPMFRNAWSAEKLDELKAGMPLGRFARVDDVSSVVAFLASDDSKFMTGGFLKVDGGCVSF
ncbi:NAD(P)-binding protein [Polyplosphaeria fusca]|uniref:NAD(P)-binding protein n=1 Tax=Polyplosphaeria fusca TaxID=682080 RepID=A0A9P4UXM8_9PLEO|nr:NAD(P)-binding protein [Polyplosphaeria fusca]